LTMKVSLKLLMIRNPKDFGVWSPCPSGVHSVITKLEMLPCGNWDDLIGPYEPD
jgi:hypothetical protein